MPETGPERETDGRRDRVASMAALRSRIAEIERCGVALNDEEAGAARVLAFGVGEIDKALPWDGLPHGAVHEIGGHDSRDRAAVAGLCAALLGRNGEGPVLWCVRRDHGHERGLPYGAGLQGFGFAPSRLILALFRRDEDVLWAMEEGLKCRHLTAVVGEVGDLDLTAGRRLSLAAKAHGVTAFLLSGRLCQASAAWTRWRVLAAPSEGAPPFDGVGRPRWRVELVRCRSAAPKSWLVEWRYETHSFRMVPALADRPAVPRESCALQAG